MTKAVEKMGKAKDTSPALAQSAGYATEQLPRS